MNALIDVTNNVILTVGDATDYGGPWGSMLKDGRAKLVPAPDGAPVEELVLVGGAVVVDAAKKAARVAKDAAKAERKERLKNHDAGGANSVAALRAIVTDLLAELRGDG